MNKSLKSSLIASVLSFSVIVSTPAFGAPASITNGDFEDGLNLATSIEGWTTLNQRIDLGTTSIAGCLTEDTSDYSNLREFFAEAGKEFFDDIVVETDGTFEYKIFVNDGVTITSASANADGDEVTFTANNDYQVGDFVTVAWGGSVAWQVEGAEVTFANSTSFKVGGSFPTIQGTDSADGGTANSFVTASNLPFGYRDDGDVETAFLQLDFGLDPSQRLYYQDWSEAQRAAVGEMTRDPEVAKDSLEIPFDDGEPEYRSGLRTNTPEAEYDDDWQSYNELFARDSQFVSLWSDMDAAGESMNRLGYVLHGPAIYSDEFSAKTVDDLSFSFAASDDGDDFKVFGYLLNTADCSQTEVLDATGETQVWETVTAAIPADGTYRFVFVAGTYDQNWGSGSGAVLFLDDAILAPNLERLALAQTGSDLQWLLVAGLTAAVVGSGLLVASRRKRVW
jgi:LPXTG-motif cell wall-anchored protein